jgi:hypothetical protein
MEGKPLFCAVEDEKRRHKEVVQISIPEPPSGALGLIPVEIEEKKRNRREAFCCGDFPAPISSEIAIDAAGLRLCDDSDKQFVSNEG